METTQPFSVSPDVQRLLDQNAAIIEAKKARDRAEVELRLFLADPTKEGQLPPNWRAAGLCLEGCSVNARGHPGLHAGEEHPVCALPAGHPGGRHFCLPGDQTRYAECPTCKNLVPKRAIKRHIMAHTGEARKNPAALKEAVRRDVALYLRQFTIRNPGAGGVAMWGHTDVGQFMENVAWHIEVGRWNPTGSYVKTQVEHANLKLHDAGYPTMEWGVRAMRKALTAWNQNTPPAVAGA